VGVGHSGYIYYKRTSPEILFSAHLSVLSLFPHALSHRTVHQGPKLVHFSIEWLSFVTSKVGVVCNRNFTCYIHNSTPQAL